jgi:hypothetical protein
LELPIAAFEKEIALRKNRFLDPLVGTPNGSYFQLDRVCLQCIHQAAAKGDPFSFKLAGLWLLKIRKARRSTLKKNNFIPI